MKVGKRKREANQSTRAKEQRTKDETKKFEKTVRS